MQANDWDKTEYTSRKPGTRHRYPWVLESTAYSIVVTGFSCCIVQHFNKYLQVNVKQKLATDFPMPRIPKQKNRRSHRFILSSGKNANSRCVAPVFVLFLLHLSFPVRNIWPSYTGLLSDFWTCIRIQRIFCWLYYVEGQRSTSPTFTIVLKGDTATLRTPPVQQQETLKGSTIHSLAFHQVLTGDMIMKFKIKTIVALLSIGPCIPSLYILQQCKGSCCIACGKNVNTIWKGEILPWWSRGRSFEIQIEHVNRQRKYHGRFYFCISMDFLFLPICFSQRNPVHTIQ